MGEHMDGAFDPSCEHVWYLAKVDTGNYVGVVQVDTSVMMSGWLQIILINLDFQFNWFDQQTRHNMQYAPGWIINANSTIYNLTHISYIRRRARVKYNSKYMVYE